MEKQDLKQFTDIMMGLAENCPGAVPSIIGLKFRFAVLEKFTIDQVAMAAMKLLRIHKYNSLPTVADMINTIDLGQANRAEIEAGKVLENLHFFGTSVTPSFSDPITKHLMSHRWRCYSWASRVQESELKWWTRDFIRAYAVQTAMLVSLLDCP